MKTIITTTNKDFEGIVKEASHLLERNNKHKWQDTFKGYADDVSKRLNESDYEKRGRLIKIKKYSKELQIYSAISMVKKSSKRTAYYDLRFRGQHICEVRVNGKEEINLCFTKADIKNNKSHFDIKTSLKAKTLYPISEAPATEFLGKFWTVPHRDEKGKRRGKSPEHKLESLLLRELAVPEGDRKVEGLKFMQPIKFGNGFFQMKTAFRASKPEDIRYCIDERGAATGGGIDILARMATPKTKNNWSLSVIELKDENKESELVNKVMEQALIYATFIAYLLADEKCGETWYNIFRDQKDPAKLPDSIDILVIAMMPPNEDPDKDKIDREAITLEIGGRTINLRPYTAFIEHNIDVTKITNTSGTYLEIKRKSN